MWSGRPLAAHCAAVRAASSLILFRTYIRTGVCGTFGRRCCGGCGCGWFRVCASSASMCWIACCSRRISCWLAAICCADGCLCCCVCCARSVRALRRGAMVCSRRCLFAGMSLVPVVGMFIRPLAACNHVVMLLMNCRRCRLGSRVLVVLWNCIYAAVSARRILLVRSSLVLSVVSSACDRSGVRLLSSGSSPPPSLLVPCVRLLLSSVALVAVLVCVRVDVCAAVACGLPSGCLCWPFGLVVWCAVATTNSLSPASV